MNVHPLREELIEKASYRDPGNASDFEGSGGKANGKTTIDDLLAEAIADALDAHAWAGLDIPADEKLLGDLVTPGSRTFLVGMTGLGKTLLAYELAGGMASGKGFLHWKCDRPSRWLVIDGEMPSSLIKKRIAKVLARHKVPPGRIIIYSLGRSEELASLIPGLGELQPLNTPQGQEWVMRVARLLKVDGIIFDNLMSLVPGEHKDEQPWRETIPLVMAISAAGMAQIWLDHTGWNTDRQYGSSTKAWRFDAVGVMKPLLEVERGTQGVAFTLSFENPGKCRRRTPDNWRDFETRTIRLAGDEWTSDTAEKAAKPSKRVDGWYRDLVNMFAIPGRAEQRTVMLGGGKTLPEGVLTLTRAQVREGYRKSGRIGSEGAHAPLTEAERTELRKRLNQLKDEGKIGIADDLIWLAKAT